MKSKTRTMLDKMYDVFIEKFHDPVKSWDKLLEFLVADNSGSQIYKLNNRFEWLIQDSKLTDSVNNLYDSELLKSDYYDHLGDMYLEKIITKYAPKRKDIILTPQSLAESLAENIVKRTDMPMTILDPNVGTGRIIMAAHKIAPNATFFGVNKNLDLLRIALANLSIHNIPGYLLHADRHIHNIDLATEAGRNNWKYANMWFSCMDKLKPAETKSDNNSSNPQIPINL